MQKPQSINAASRKQRNFHEKSPACCFSAGGTTRVANTVGYKTK